jgi:hypothetical protein
MNSVVPNVFGSMTPPQLGLSVTVRCGPMPLRQWYSSAKHPPGQRTFGTFYRSKRSDDIVADSACVWNLGIWTDPDALVNTVAKVLSELAEDVAVNLRAGLGNVNG